MINIMRISFICAVTLSAVVVMADPPAKPSRLQRDIPYLPPMERTIDTSMLYTTYDTLLKDTGFPDLPAAIQKTLSSPEATNLEQINRETLEANWKRLQIINNARELATELLTVFVPQLSDQNAAARIAELNARWLAQKRLEIPDAFPDEIRNIRNQDQRAEAKAKYLTQLIEKNIVRMREQMLADSLYAMYGVSDFKARYSGQTRDVQFETQVRRLDVLINRYVRSLYFDHEMGLGQWVGEALAIGLVHTSRVSRDRVVRDFEARLDHRTSAYGHYLSDSITDTLTFETPEGKAEKIQIKTADVLSEMYADSNISRLTATGARPHILNRFKAAKEGLIQPLVIALVAADENALMNKVVEGKKLSWADKLRLDTANSNVAKLGASHAGMAVVFRNPQSGVAVTRAIDQSNVGPVPWGCTRFVSVKSIYVVPGVYASLGVSSFSPAKMLAYLQELTKEKGFEPVFKVSNVFRPDENRKLKQAEGETFNWTPRITAIDQQKILNVRMAEAEKWFTNDLAPRLAAEMIRNITDHGMAFRTYGVDPSNKMACYCTESIKIAGFRETGFDLQSNLDRTTWVARLGRKIIPQMKIVPEETPISPNFASWDPKTDSKIVNFRLHSPVEKFGTQMSPMLADLNPEVRPMILKFMDRRMNYNQGLLGEAFYSPEQYLSRTEITVVEPGEKPSKATFVPRARPMGTTNPMAKTIPYNPVPPATATVADLTAAGPTAEAFRNTLIASGVKHPSTAVPSLMSDLMPRLNDPTTAANVISFVAKMMALKPLNPPREIPHEIRVLTGDAREAALTKHLVAITNQQIETQSKQILSDLAGILFGQDVVLQSAEKPFFPRRKEVREKLNAYYDLIFASVKELYVEQTTADRRSLGLGLAILLHDQAMKLGKADWLTSLELNLKTYNLTPKDFFGKPLNPRKFRRLPVSALEPLPNPGAMITFRLTQPMKDKTLTPSEKLQLRYSPYNEVQPKITLALPSLLIPQPMKARFTPMEQVTIVYRIVSGYMEPMNKAQVGTTGNIFSSDYMKANQTVRTCRDLFGY